MNATNKKSIQDQIDQATPRPNSKTPKLYRIGNADFQLQVTASGVKSWIFRYTFKRRTRAMGLGSARRISFDEATKRARKARVLLDDGIDPLAERDRLKKTEMQRMTFRECAEAYIKAHEDGYPSDYQPDARTAASSFCMESWPAQLERIKSTYRADLERQKKAR